MMLFVRPIMENVDEIFQKIPKKKIVTKKLNIDDKTVLGHLRKTEWKKAQCLGAHDLTKKFNGPIFPFANHC